MFLLPSSLLFPEEIRYRRKRFILKPTVLDPFHDNRRSQEY